MFQGYRQLLFALLSLMLLGQSLLVVADSASIDDRPSSAQSLLGSCDESCCDAAGDDRASGCELVGCGGDCHPYCLCQGLCVPLGVTSSESDFKLPAVQATPPPFRHCHHQNVEPQVLLRPPCT